MSEDMRENLGVCIDELSNVNAALSLPMPAELHVTALRASLPHLIEAMKTAYVGAFNENPWATAPKD